jgi:hypothetical protein
MNRKNNSVRPFISIAITIASVILVISGIALFCAPKCKVAEKIGWQFLFISKETWESTHITFAFLFLFLTIIHLVLNWKILITYFKNGQYRIPMPNRTVIFCTLAAIAFFIMSALEIPPVSWLHKAHENIKASWGSISTMQKQSQGNKCNFKEDKYQI